MKNGVKRGKVGNQETSWEAVRENKEETTECLMERLGVDRRQKKSRCVPAHFGARSTGGLWGGGQGKTECGPGLPGGLSLMWVERTTEICSHPASVPTGRLLRTCRLPSHGLLVLSPSSCDTAGHVLFPKTSFSLGFQDPTLSWLFPSSTGFLRRLLTLPTCFAW